MSNVGQFKLASQKLVLPLCVTRSVNLSDMDSEIQMHKQGMMQQLLTGKIRLIKPESQGARYAG